MGIFKDWFGKPERQADELRDVTGDFRVVAKDASKHLPNICFWASTAEPGDEHVAYTKVACGPTCGPLCRCGNPFRCVLLRSGTPRWRIFLDLCIAADLAMKPSPKMIDVSKPGQPRRYLPVVPETA